MSPVNTTASPPLKPPGAAVEAGRLAAPLLGSPPERSPTRKESIPAVCPGVFSGQTSSVPNRSVSPACTEPMLAAPESALAVGGAGAHQVALDRVDHHLQLRPALAQLVDIADVVVVVMGEQHVRGRQSEPLGGVDQRLHGTAGVDEERRAALAVGDEVGVRENWGLLEVSTITAAILARWPSRRANETAQALQVALVADVAAPLQHADRARAADDRARAPRSSWARS